MYVIRVTTEDIGMKGTKLEKAFIERLNNDTKVNVGVGECVID